MSEKLNAKEEAPLKLLSLAFISLIFIIIIMAIGTQLVFSPEKVTGWVREGLATTGLKSELDKADLSVSFNRAQTTLTGSVFFPVGVRIKNFKVLSDNGCKKMETVFSSVVVPFSIFKAFEGKLSLGRVKLNKGVTEEIDLCPPSETKNKAFGGNSDQSQFNDNKASNKLKRKISGLNTKIVDIISRYQNTKSSHQKVSGVLIYDWTFKPKNLDLVFNINRLKFTTAEGELSLRGEWSSVLEYKDNKIDISGDLKVFSQSFKVKSSLDYKEGRVTLNYEKQKNKNSTFVTSAENIPVSLVVSLFGRKLNSSLSSSFLRNSWITFKSETEFDKDLVTKVSHLKVKSEGDGLIELTSKAMKLYLDDTDGLSLKKPSRLLFTKFKALDILSQENQTEIKKIMPEFGEFNSVIEMSNNFQITGEFEAKKQTFLLRSMGQSGYQTVDSSVGDFRFKNAKDFEVNLSQIKLDKGEFEGDISYQVSSGKSVLKTNITLLNLSEKLWKSSFNLQELGSLSLKGFIDLNESEAEGETKEKHKLKSEFVLNIERVKNSIWTFNELSFECAFENSLFCSFGFKDFNLIGKLKAYVSENNLNQYFEAMSNKGELTFENKLLDFSVYPKKPKNQNIMSLIWSEGEGTVLKSGQDVEIKVREI